MISSTLRRLDRLRAPLARVARAQRSTKWSCPAPVRSHGHGAGGHGDASMHRMPASASESEQRAATAVINSGTLSDLVLAIGKGGAGVWSGSSALISDAVHSLADMLISMTTLITTRIAAKRPDHDHPHGHGRVDSLGALAVSALLVATGGTISLRAFDSVSSVLRGLPTEPLFAVFEQTPTDLLAGNPAGAAVAVAACLASVGVKEWIYRWTMQVGIRMRSQALIANAWHHRSDSLSSLVAAVGVGGALAGLPVLDPIAALVVGAMIARAGATTGVTAVRELMDERLDDEAIAAAVDACRAQADVAVVRRMRGRRAGPAVLLDAEVAIAPDITVAAADAIAARIRAAVFRERREVAELLIHFVPATPADAEAAAASSGGLTPRPAAATAAAAAATAPGERNHDVPEAFDAEELPEVLEVAAARLSMDEIAGLVREVLTAAPAAAPGSITAAALPSRRVGGTTAPSSSSSSSAPSSSCVRAVTALEVHAESATSRLLHVHARVALDGAVPVREALVTLRRARAAVLAMQVPVYKQPQQAAVSSGVPTEGSDDAWRVASCDVNLEQAQV